MTTVIKSTAAEGVRELDVTLRTDDRVNLSVHGGAAIQVPTAELLAALNAEPKSVAEGLRAKLAEKVRTFYSGNAEADRLRSELEKAEKALAAVTAERDAHAATIGRVREVAERWRYKGEFGWGPWQAGEGPDPEGEILDRASSELRAALDPEPALPTEPGSVIFIDADVTQERDGILAACQRDGRFRALDGSAGGWDRDTITAWRPAKVVAE